MKITFIGGGNMAQAMIGGLKKQGYSAAGIQVVEPNEATRQQLTERFGVRTTGAIDASALNCEVVLLAVKPQVMREAIAPLAGKLDTQLVISIAAGLRLSDLRRWLADYRNLVRAMPNTPALIGAGISGVCAEAGVGVEARQVAERVLHAIGQVVWIDDEAQMDAVTAVSGSGPAYVFRFIEALETAGVELGLPAPAARALAIETFLGASRLAAQGPEAPAVLRQRVTSKGGTTEAALNSLEADDIVGAIGRAVAAADARGRVMGAELGTDA